MTTDKKATEKAAADKAAADKAAADKAAAEKSVDVFVVADGKSLTSKRGILGAGKEVTSSDFAEGAFDNLCKKGYLKKTKKSVVK